MLGFLMTIVVESPSSSGPIPAAGLVGDAAGGAAEGGCTSLPVAALLLVPLFIKLVPS